MQKGSKSGTQFKYFTLSPVLKTKLPFKTLTPFINTGIYEAMLTSGMRYHFNKFHTGAVLGFGAEKKLVRNTLGIQMNWMPSLTRISKTFYSYYDGPVYYGDRTATITAFSRLAGRKNKHLL